MNKPDENVAFKCTYNDGGAESGLLDSAEPVPTGISFAM